MSRMVLRETAFGEGMRTASGTGAQVGNELIQLDAAPFYFDPDQDRAGRRFHRQVELVRRSAVLVLAGINAHVMPEPSPLENKARGGGELANVFAERSPQFPREDAVGPSWPVRGERGWKKLTRHLAMLVDSEKVFADSAAKEFVFPRAQGWSDPETGIEFALEPGFELGVQRILLAFLQLIVLPRRAGWRLLWRTNPKL